MIIFSESSCYRFATKEVLWFGGGKVHNNHFLKAMRNFCLVNLPLPDNLHIQMALFCLPQSNDCTLNRVDVGIWGRIVYMSSDEQTESSRQIFWVKRSWEINKNMRIPLSSISSASEMRKQTMLLTFLYFLRSSHRRGAYQRLSVLLVDNSSGAKSDMDMAYERARVHFALEDVASGPVVGKVGPDPWRAQCGACIVLPHIVVL